MKNCNFLSNSKGSTILENIIAFAILSGVILLLIGYTVRIISRSDTEKQIQAINLAQSDMEQVLSLKTYTDSVYFHNNWEIFRKITSIGNKVNIKIQVYYKEQQSPTTELNSVRLCSRKKVSQ